MSIARKSTEESVWITIKHPLPLSWIFLARFIPCPMITFVQPALTPSSWMFRPLMLYWLWFCLHVYDGFSFDQNLSISEYTKPIILVDWYFEHHRRSFRWEPYLYHAYAVLTFIRQRLHSAPRKLVKQLISVMSQINLITLQCLFAF